MGLLGINYNIKQIEMSKTNIFSLGPRKKSDTKNGMTAITSIIFIPSFRNLIFSGDPASLKQTYKYKTKLKNSNLPYEIFECEPSNGDCFINC